MDTIEQEALSKVKLVADSIELASQLNDKICALLKKIPHEDASHVALYNAIDGLNTSVENLKNLEHSELLKFLHMEFWKVG